METTLRGSDRGGVQVLVLQLIINKRRGGGVEGENRGRFGGGGNWEAVASLIEIIDLELFRVMA